MNLRSCIGHHPAAFHWKGRNYLDKMRCDLGFLTDGSRSWASCQIFSAWLGFSTTANPFLIPPEGYDVCEALQVEHEQSRENAASRRTERRRESLSICPAGSNKHASARRSSSAQAPQRDQLELSTNDGEQKDIYPLVVG